MTAAKLEILIAECMNSHSQLNEKLQALRRAYLFVVGSPPRQSCFFATSNHYYNEDATTALLKLQPVLLQFLLQRMRDQNESVRVAVLRTVEYTLDVLGCQVDELVLQILRALISSYPGAPAQLVSSYCLVALPSGSTLPSNFESESFSPREHPEFSHFLVGVYSHLFETLISTINSASSALLQKTFNQIITSLTHSFRLCLSRPPQQLVSFVYRISRKILAYCALELPPSYLSDLIALLSAAHLSSSAKLLLRIPPRSSAHSSLVNLWNTIRIKYLLHIHPTHQLCSWLAAQLQLEEVRSQMDQHHSSFYYYLEMVLLLSRRPSRSALLPFYAQYKEATAGMFCIPSDQMEREPPAALLNMSQREDQDFQSSVKRQSQEVQLEFIELLSPLKIALQEAKLRNNFIAFQLTWVAYSQLFQQLPKQANSVLFSTAKKYLGQVQQHIQLRGVPPVQTLKLLLQMLPSLAFQFLRSPDSGFLEFLKLFYLTFVKESIPSNITDQAFLVMGLLIDFFAALQKYHCNEILSLSSQKLYHRGKEVVDRAVHNEMVLQALRDRNLLTRDLIRTSVIALTDKYTAKSAQQKDTIAMFISLMLATHKAPQKSQQQYPPRNDERVSPDERRALDGTLDLEFQSQEICGGDWDSNNSLRAAFDPDFFLREVQERTLIRFQDLLSVCFLQNQFTLKPRISGGSLLSDNRKSVIENRKSGFENKAGKSVAFAFKRNFEQLQEGRGLKGSLARRTEIDKKQQLQIHEQQLERIELFLQVLKAFKPEHLPLLQYMLYLKEFRFACLRILESGHLTLRLKVFEILNLLCDFSLNSGDQGSLPSRDQLALAQLLLAVSNFSFTKHPNDSFLHFQNLQLLLRIFKDVLPPVSVLRVQVPPIPSLTSLYPLYKDEIIRSDLLDLQGLDLMTDMPNLDRKKYSCMRAVLVTKQWSHISEKGVNSPWANMRSLSYTLLNVIYRIDLHECSGSLRERLLGLIIPLLSLLLTSKESDSNAGGLNILGALCGLQGNFKGHISLQSFKTNAVFINQELWTRVYELSHEADLTLRDAAELLVQLCAPRDLVERLYQLRKGQQSRKLKTALQRLLQPEEIIEKQQGDVKLIGEFQQLMLSEPDYSDHISPLQGYALVKEDRSTEGYQFYVDKMNEDELRQKLRLFKNDYLAPKGLWVEGPSQPKRLSVMGGSFEFIGSQSHLLASQFFDEPAQVSAIDPPETQLQQSEQMPMIKDYQEEIEAQGMIETVLREKEEEKREEIKENEWEAAGVKEIQQDDDTVLQHIDDANLPILKGRRLDSPTFDVPQTGFCIKLEGGGDTPDFDKSREEKPQEIANSAPSEGETDSEKLEQIMDELGESPQFGKRAPDSRSEQTEELEEEQDESEEPCSPPPHPMTLPNSDDFQKTGLSPAYSVPGESLPQDAQKVRGLLNHSFEGLSVSIQNTSKVILKGKCASQIIPPTGECFQQEKKCFTNPRSLNISHSSNGSSPPTRTALSATAKPDQLFKHGTGIFVLELEEGEGIHAESMKASSVSPKTRSLLRPQPSLWKPLMKPTQNSDAIRIGDCSPKRRQSARGRATVALKPRITSYHNPSQRLTPQTIKPLADTTGLVLSPSVTRKQGMIAALNRNEQLSSILKTKFRDSNSRLTLPPNLQRLLPQPDI